MTIELTVKQVAKHSGVSVRTLHHYDEIGLLKPAYIGENRYRYYGKAELLRLQQILFYREFGIPLSEIAALLDRPDFDHAAALAEHRQRLVAEAERYRQLIDTIDHTITQLKGRGQMKTEDLYKGFAPEKQAEYESWLVEQHGEPMKRHIDQSKAHLAGSSRGDHQAMMTELAELENGLADALRRGQSASDEALEPLLSRHRHWVATMWGHPCEPQAYAGLADLYLSHPDFVARYETIETGFAEFLAAAMKAHAARHGHKP